MSFLQCGFGGLTLHKILLLLLGAIRIEVRGGAPQNALNGLTNRHIAFWNVEWVDLVTVRITIQSRHENRAMECIKKAMCECVCVRQFGWPYFWKRCVARSVLLASGLICVLVAVVLPRFVFFYEVAGNDKVSGTKILRTLNEIGIGFGTYGPNIHPNWVKNHMIQKIPELQWVTITQNGCKATIIVRERIQVPEIDNQKGFANVIARRSGIITEQSVFRGQAQYRIGDTVKQGDVLVSGVVDLERTYRIEHARAEIFARTWQNKRVCIPSTYTKQGEQTRNHLCIWLVVGKNRIKIFGNSGIYHDSCDKMISKMALTLFDGLKIPVFLEVERYRLYGNESIELDCDTAKVMAEEYAFRTVQRELQAGNILNLSAKTQVKPDCFLFDTIVECHEMIAESVPAKWNYEEVMYD